MYYATCLRGNTTIRTSLTKCGNLTWSWFSKIERSSSHLFTPSSLASWLRYSLLTTHGQQILIGVYQSLHVLRQPRLSAAYCWGMKTAIILSELTASSDFDGTVGCCETSAGISKIFGTCWCFHPDTHDCEHAAASDFACLHDQIVNASEIPHQILQMSTPWVFESLNLFIAQIWNTHNIHSFWAQSNTTCLPIVAYTCRIRSRLSKCIPCPLHVGPDFVLGWQIRIHSLFNKVWPSERTIREISKFTIQHEFPTIYTSSSIALRHLRGQRGWSRTLLCRYLETKNETFFATSFKELAMNSNQDAQSRSKQTFTFLDLVFTFTHQCRRNEYFHFVSLFLWIRHQLPSQFGEILYLYDSLVYSELLETSSYIIFDENRCG